MTVPEKNAHTVNNMAVKANAQTSSKNNRAPASQERVDRNKELQEQYVAALVVVQEAEKNGDEEKIKAAKYKLGDIADTFVRENTKLVYEVSKRFMQNDNSKEDLVQQGLMGLWEAFVGTKSELANQITIDEEGNASLVAGWDADRSTFGTTSRRHIDGRVRRGIPLSEGSYHGMSYTTFQKVPRVKAAIERLRDQGNYSPSYVQIADEAKVAPTVVSEILAGTPMSLAAPVGGDHEGSFTLQDMVAESLASHDESYETAVEVANTYLQQVSNEVPLVDLIAYAIRYGLTEMPSKTIASTATTIGMGRGWTSNATSRVALALHQHLPDIDVPGYSNVDDTLPLEEVEEEDVVEEKPTLAKQQLKLLP